MKQSWRPWTQRLHTATEGGEEIIDWETAHAPASLVTFDAVISVASSTCNIPGTSPARYSSHNGSGMIFVSTSESLRHRSGCFCFGFRRLKINCVVMNGVNTDELADFLDFTRDQELDVRFIEWMPFDDNRWKDSKFFSYQVWRLSTPM